ncbi:MAG: PP2C family protein-serine/threonine phosphatase [Lachnospiraceae bacterium]|nr:PP2C family protein-serine/threonine phosphatase [Lachnospiraceae bacterium]
MKDKKIFITGLTGRLILGLAVFVAAVTAGSIIVGVRTYRNSIYRHYNDIGYQIAQSVELLFDYEELEEWGELTYRFNTTGEGADEIAEITSSERFMELEETLLNLRTGMDVNDIFVGVINLGELSEFTMEGIMDGSWAPIYYIMDTYPMEEYRFSFGDRSPITPDYIEGAGISYASGIPYDGYFVNEGNYGYNITAVYPVVRDGKTIAFVGVETPMRTLESDLNRYIFIVLVIVCIISAVLFIITAFILVNLLIKPIKLISHEAAYFVENENEVSENLRKVRNRDEIQVLAESVLAMEIGINEYIANLTKITAEKERIGAELNVATQIQADMLPRIFPAFPERTEFDLYASMSPAKEVGGDFYDFFLIDDDHIGLVMADVSGKGVPAALFMVIAKTLIKNRAQMGGSPAEVLAYANDQLGEGNEAELFVTVWFAIIQISTGKGFAANAGHEHPAIRRKDGKFELVKYRHSPAVATLSGIKFKEHEFQLNPGDSLYVYTDGVTEATRSDDVLFGIDRMLGALNKNPDADPKTMLENVRSDIDLFVGEAPQFDDITMLGFKYLGSGKES